MSNFIIYARLLVLLGPRGSLEEREGDERRAIRLILERVFVRMGDGWKWLVRIICH
jgi:hypothetical protein